MKRYFTCIMCPIGCEIDVETENGKVISVKGNRCPQGKAFALRELKEPMRVLTTTVKIEGADYVMLPVRTDRPVPKRKIFEIMREVSKITVKAPVRIYDVISENICGSGANLVATRSMRKREK